MRVKWTLRARRDLDDVRRYIAAHDVHAARRWIERIRAKTRAAAQMPGIGRIAPGHDREDVREVFLGSYRIVYRVMAEEIRVLTVFEGHRRPPTDLAHPANDDG